MLTLKNVESFGHMQNFWTCNINDNRCCVWNDVNEREKTA